MSSPPHLGITSSEPNVEEHNSHGIKFMSNVAKDIIKINPSGRTFDNIWDEFYKIMRHYGIKKGRKSENGVGVVCNNFEWSMCEALFFSRVRDYMAMSDLLDDCPEDLMHY